MSLPQIPTHPASAPLASEYEAIAAGDRAEGPRGHLRFAVSTADLAEGKGDVYVAVGLARALAADGWGVALWPAERWAEPVPEGTTAVVSMIESFVPGAVPVGVAVLAWVRNWTERWAALPYLDEFDAVWTSSSIARDAVLAGGYSGHVDVVPIAVDADLFTDERSANESARTDRAVTTVNFWGVRRTVQDVLETVDPPSPIVWFAANEQLLEPSPGVELRPMVPYLALPEVYRAAAFVVDDVIAPAAAFGTLNSRLYESLASGALPVTDCALGLDELGLSDLPVFSDAVGLATLLAMPEDERSALVERLRTVVLERHTYAARAATVAPLLDAAVARASKRTGDRSAMLAWGTALREELRTTAHERDVHRQGVDDINDRLIAAHAEIAALDAARIRAEHERDTIAARYARITSLLPMRTALALRERVRGARR